MTSPPPLPGDHAPGSPEPGAALVPVHDRADILPEYRGTPVETLLAAHDLGHRATRVDAPEIVIATCMDPRIALALPGNFAFVIRTAGACVEPLVFNVACALAVSPASAVAVIGHSDCAMVDVNRHRAPFVEMVSRLGPLSVEQADELFTAGARRFGCDDAVAHTLAQCAELRRVLGSVLVAPLFYDVHDGTIQQIQPAATAALETSSSAAS